MVEDDGVYYLSSDEEYVPLRRPVSVNSVTRADRSGRVARSHPRVEHQAAAVMANRVRMVKVAPFDGNAATFHKFREEVMVKCSAHGFDDEEKKAVILNAVEGVALTTIAWWLREGQLEGLSAEQLWQKMEAAFTDETATEQENYLQFRTRKLQAGETIDQYLVVFLDMAHRADVAGSDVQMRTQWIENMPPEIRADVTRSAPRDFNEAVRAARGAYAAANLKKGSTYKAHPLVAAVEAAHGGEETPTERMMQQVSELVALVHSQKKLIEEQKRTLEERNAPQMPPRKPVPGHGQGMPSQGRKNNDMVCHTCGGRGHFARDCRRGWKAPETCQYCGKFGHREEDCWSKQRDEEAGRADRKVSALARQLN